MRFGLAVIALLVIAGCSDTPRPRTDSEVTAHFTEHKDAFEVIAKMALEDRELSTFYDDGSFDGKITDERAEEYLRAIADAGLEKAMIWRSEVDGKVDIEIHPELWIEGSRFKSLIYTTDDIGPRMREGRGDERIYEPCVPLAPNWYLSIMRLGDGAD